MKQYLKQYRTYLGIILGVFFCSAFSLSIIPWLKWLPESGQQVLAYVIASVFWLGMILGFVFTGIMNSKMRRARAKVYSAKKFKRQRLPGILTFSSEPARLAIYFGIGAGLILSVADLMKTFIPTRIMFFIISVTYFLIVLHAVVDGKNYRIYKIIEAEK